MGTQTDAHDDVQKTSALEVFRLQQVSQMDAKVDKINSAWQQAHMCMTSYGKLHDSAIQEYESIFAQFRERFARLESSVVREMRDKFDEYEQDLSNTLGLGPVERKLENMEQNFNELMIQSVAHDEALMKIGPYVNGFLGPLAQFVLWKQVRDGELARGVSAVPKWTNPFGPRESDEQYRLVVATNSAIKAQQRMIESGLLLPNDRNFPFVQPFTSNTATADANIVELTQDVSDSDVMDETVDEEEERQRRRDRRHEAMEDGEYFGSGDDFSGDDE